jgi:predicted ATPase
MHPRDAKSPFLKELRFDPPRGRKDFPYNVPLFTRPFKLEFTKPITIIVGDNGTGKSTLLESIAAKCGFALEGGNRNHAGDAAYNKTPLDESLELSWVPRIHQGFFLRAETFTNFAKKVDNLDASWAYGGKSLHAQSHGESFMSLFNSRLENGGVFILDEPEAALSPVRQLGFMKLLHDVEKLREAQIIMATHSPILLSYPGADVLELADGEFRRIDYRESEHFRITADFLKDPERFFRHLFKDEL